MDKQQLIENLRMYANFGDKEIGHTLADKDLLKYIDDIDIRAAYEEIEKWYA